MGETQRRDQTRVWFETGWILAPVQIRGHNQAGLSAGSANEFEHLLVAVKGLGSPVFGDLGEQAVLDGIPLGGTGRIMSNGGGNAEPIAYLCLDFRLPGPGGATVTAAGVCQNQKFGRTAITTDSFAFPPCGDGMGSEGRGVMRDADTNGAAVVGWIINAIGDAYPAGVGAEVVIVHQNGRAIPIWRRRF